MPDEPVNGYRAGYRYPGARFTGNIALTCGVKLYPGTLRDRLRGINGAPEQTTEGTMKEHVVNVQLRIQARDGITRAEIQRDLLKQLSVIQEQAPYRGTDGAQWWTNSDAAVRFTANA